MSRLVVLYALLVSCFGCGSSDDGTKPPDGEQPIELSLEERTRNFCSGCHRYAPPDTLPRDMWARKVRVMFDLARGDKETDLSLLPKPEAIISFYEERAPERLPSVSTSVGQPPGPVSFVRNPVRLNKDAPYPAVSNLELVDLNGPRGKGRYLLMSDMRFGLVALVHIDFSNGKTTVFPLVQARHPARAEIVDFDRDGRFDVLVSDLGYPSPTDDLLGSLEYFRQTDGGRFEKKTLLTGVGRVADARAADVDGDGDLDIVCAIFGWRKVGEITYLENVTSAGGELEFKRTLLDPRSGAINVPIVDLNGDGLLDIVAVISQHHETVFAYLQKKGGGFIPRELYRAPHPNWGYASMQLVDLDADGDLDFLLANGDTLDDIVVKPYHGIRWLENRGDLKFESREIAILYGTYSARAGDFDGDGDLDIAACSFLPRIKRDDPAVRKVDSMIWLEQVSPGQFRRHPLEAAFPFHPSMGVGDIDGDGRTDIFVGNMTMKTDASSALDHNFAIFRNLGSN